MPLSGLQILCAVMRLLLAAQSPAIAQSFLEFLQRPILERDDGRYMMYSYVDRNLPPIELPDNKAAWEAARPRLLAEIRRLVGLGDVDRRGPVKWTSKGRIDRETYTIEKILFESYPGMMVPALVYTPKRLIAPAPAMVSISGHTSCDSKAAVDVQARATNLVRRGLIVIAYDYIGMFERNTGENPCAGMPYGGGNDHGLRSFSYTAGNPTGLEILDGIRAIDYLYTRNDVDRKRIGFTGESGGSNSTYWVSALDERVGLAVPVASVTTFDYWIRNNRNWDWHQRPAGIRRIAEISTLLALVAPRPLLVISSLRGTDAQEFPFDEAEKSVQEAKRVYDLYGAAANIELAESSTSHGYQADKRERMYTWVERFFFGRKTASREFPFVFEPKDDLRCGLPPGNKTWAEIYREWLERPTKESGDIRRRLRDLLGLDSRDFRAVLNVQSTVSRGDAVIRRLIIESEPGIRLPAVEYTPRNRSISREVIVLGRSTEVGAAIEPLLARDLRAVFIDLRGTGEIDSGGGRTDNWAWFLGRPWPGMWVQDIQSVITALSTEHPSVSMGVIGAGQFGKAALFSAALDRRIGAVQVRLPSLSYRDEAARDLLADVPRILAALDLPQVATLVSPRACWLTFAGSVPEERIRSLYQPGTAAKGGFRAERAGATDWPAVANWFSERLPESDPGGR